MIQMMFILLFTRNSMKAKIQIYAPVKNIQYITCISKSLIQILLAHNLRQKQFIFFTMLQYKMMD